MSEASSGYLPRRFAVRQISTSTSVNTGCYLTSITRFPDLPQIWGNLRRTAVCIWRHGIPLVKFYNCCKVLGRRRLTCNLQYEFLDSSMPVEIIKRNNASYLCSRGSVVACWVWLFWNDYNKMVWWGNLPIVQRDNDPLDWDQGILV